MQRSTLRLCRKNELHQVALQASNIEDLNEVVRTSLSVMAKQWSDAMSTFHEKFDSLSDLIINHGNCFLQIFFEPFRSRRFCIKKFNILYFIRSCMKLTVLLSVFPFALKHCWCFTITNWLTSALSLYQKRSYDNI